MYYIFYNTIGQNYCLTNSFFNTAMYFFQQLTFFPLFNCFMFTQVCWKEHVWEESIWDEVDLKLPIIKFDDKVAIEDCLRFRLPRPCSWIRKNKSKDMHITSRWQIWAVKKEKKNHQQLESYGFVKSRCICHENKLVCSTLYII